MNKRNLLNQFDVMAASIKSTLKILAENIKKQESPFNISNVSVVYDYASVVVKFDFKIDDSEYFGVFIYNNLVNNIDATFQVMHLKKLVEIDTDVHSFEYCSDLSEDTINKLLEIINDAAK